MIMLLLSAALAAEGSLFVQVTSGSGGRIFVDGVDTGADAPGTVQVEEGNRLIQVKGDCMSAVKSADVLPGRVTRVDMDMQPVGGFAEISAMPKEATATLDGNELALPAALPLTCGTHALVVEAKGYATQRRDVVVEMGGAYNIQVDLPLEGFGSIAVLVDPVDATVYLNGVQVAVGPTNVDEVPEGPQVVSAKKEGVGEVEETVKVLSGETTQVTLTIGNAVSTADPLPDPDVPKEPRERTGAGMKVVGGTLAAAGVVAIGYGSYQRYQGYQLHYAVDNDPRDNQIDSGKADLYDDTKQDIVDARRTSLIMWGAGAVLAGTGVVLLVDDQGTQGAMVTTTVRF